MGCNRWAIMSQNHNLWPRWLVTCTNVVCQPTDVPDTDAHNLSHENNNNSIVGFSGDAIKFIRDQTVSSGLT